MDPIDAALEKIIIKSATDNDVRISNMEINPSYVYVVIECRPQHYILSVVKAFKGVSARLLLKKFPELKDKIIKGHLWHASYLVTTEASCIRKKKEKYLSKQIKM